MVLNKVSSKLRTLCVEHWFENLMILQLNYYSNRTLSNDISIDTDSCEFCNRYFQYNFCEESEKCRGCPIKKTTKNPNCKGTPYYKFVEALDDYAWPSRNPKRDFNKLFKLIADEINFLLSLR